MEMIIVLVAILQSIAISLGVGCSTLAITNFFVAIADGKIDENERKMMGVVYIVLRVAMILILTTTTVLSMYAYATPGSFTTVTAAIWTLVAVLFGNAVLMTKHIMPSNIGPALQAGTWYTLGVTMSLIPLGLSSFSYFQFIVGYAAAVALAIAIVNGMMSYLKKKRA